MAKTNNSYPLSYVTQNLDKMMSELVAECGTRIDKDASEVLKKCADDYSQQLKNVTPSSTKNTVHLKDTIQVSEQKSQYYGKVQKAQVVHFKKWQIAHLLEFGWTAKNGMKVVRNPFIRPLFDSNKNKYYKWMKEGLQK